MRLFRPVFPAGCLYPDAIFRIKTNEKVLYLTFDDGPDPLTTPVLLSILRKHNVPALFFCTGMAAEKYPVLMKQIRDEGHGIGNHSYTHSDGWRTNTKNYLEDVMKASALTSDKIFRPPYGRLRLSQYGLLKKQFRIVLWDVMAYDFDAGFGRERSMEVLKKKIRKGSVIVLHDREGSMANLLVEEFLAFAFAEGYRFEIEANPLPPEGGTIQDGISKPPAP
jgi:peptidoglycan-N-acetylglucosamine deacetylase